VSRVDIYGRILTGERHLDVRANYHDGPVPCIAQRVQYLNETLLPLTVQLVEEVMDQIVEEHKAQTCTTCGCARVRCKQAPERFGTERCCEDCDH
jgi:hypothetical protein